MEVKSIHVKKQTRLNKNASACIAYVNNLPWKSLFIISVIDRGQFTSTIYEIRKCAYHHFAIGKVLSISPDIDVSKMYTLDGKFKHVFACFQIYIFRF